MLRKKKHKYADDSVNYASNKKVNEAKMLMEKEVSNPII